jgi:hypothetical protein
LLGLKKSLRGFVLGKKDKAIGVWLPPGFDLSRSYDLQALSTGTANKEQQIAALKYIVENIASAYNERFDASNNVFNNYESGRRSVGHAIAQICKLNLAEVKKHLNPKEK